MNTTFKFLALIIALLTFNIVIAQEAIDSSLLTIDRIYNSSEFKQERERRIQWIENGDSYVTIEKSEAGADELVRYSTAKQKRSVFIPAEALSVNAKSLEIKSFTLSPDGKKVLIFNNTSRVWRSFTKGDYWVYDLDTKKLKTEFRRQPKH